MRILFGLFTATMFGLLGCESGDIDMMMGPPPDATPDPDCPAELACESIPAAYAISDTTSGSYGNYDLANRPDDGLDIRYIVIHDTDSLFDDALYLFKDPANVAAAHYVVRSSDGHVVKMIAPQNVAWHAGNWYFNMHSIGIEHSGWAFEGWRWYSEEMYQSSAKLVRFLAQRYNIPLDRQHILGHEEVPGITQAKQKGMHWDPGPYWDWDHYMDLLRGESSGPRSDSGAAGIIAIAPEFAQNIPQPTLSYCYSPDESSDCRALGDRPVNFVFLRTAPDPTAPIITNPYLTWPDERVFNWGNRAAAGQLYYRAERQGDWDAIYYGGQKVWFANPGLGNTRAAPGMAVVVTPKAGMASVPVYGVGYPEDAAYLPPTVPATVEKIYDLPAGQRYVATPLMKADYYWAKQYLDKLDSTKNIVVKDDTEYYKIDFNHRFALVRAADVDEVP